MTSSPTRGDVAGALQAQDVGRTGWYRVGAAALHEVGVVHPGGFYRDDDFMRLGLQWLHWLPLEHVRRSWLVENDCVWQLLGPFILQRLRESIGRDNETARPVRIVDAAATLISSVVRLRVPIRSSSPRRP